MEYKGKLYGKVGNAYILLEKTTDDFDLIENKNKTTITPSKLKRKGWIEIDDPIVFMEKKLENKNPLNNDEETDISLIWHRLNNTATFAIQLGESGMLNINVNSMEELKDFEDKLLFFDPNF